VASPAGGAPFKSRILSALPVPERWVVTIAAYLAGMAVALNQFKVPPVMPVLMTTLNVDMSTGGWLMSSFAVAGVILALPAAFVLRRIGPKHAGLIALGCTVAGSAMGALAQSPAALLFSRSIEGIALGLITVVAPAVISMWFPAEQRGTPMGVWATWVPVGSFAMLNLAAPLLRLLGWRGIWWFGALFSLAVFVLYAAVVRPPPLAGAPRSPTLPAVRVDRALLTPSAWALALVFAAFSFSMMGFGTWAPSYLNEALDMNLAAASFASSVVALAGIPANIIAGGVLDRIRNRGMLLVAPLLAAGVVFFWSFRLQSGAVVLPYMMLVGATAGFIPPTIFTLAPQTMRDPASAGLAIGIISVGQNFGQLLGPPAVAAAIGNVNWESGALPLVLSMAIGLAASFWLQRHKGVGPR
jgi:predicted MFS family arabinose efflux permease